MCAGLFISSRARHNDLGVPLRNQAALRIQIGRSSIFPFLLHAPFISICACVRVPVSAFPLSAKGVCVRRAKLKTMLLFTESRPSGPQCAQSASRRDRDLLQTAPRLHPFYFRCWNVWSRDAMIIDRWQVPFSYPSSFIELRNTQILGNLSVHLTRFGTGEATSTRAAVSMTRRHRTSPCWISRPPAGVVQGCRLSNTVHTHTHAHTLFLSSRRVTGPVFCEVTPLLFTH